MDMEDGNLSKTKRKIPFYMISQKTKERTSSAVAVGRCLVEKNRDGSWREERKDE